MRIPGRSHLRPHWSSLFKELFIDIGDMHYGWDEMMPVQFSMFLSEPVAEEKHGNLGISFHIRGEAWNSGDP